MRFVNRRPMCARLLLKGIAGAALALQILNVQPPLLAQAVKAAGGNERWVGAWATALVELQRPGQGQGRGQAPQGQPPAQAPQGPPPVLAFNNQTLRQIVHVNLGGERIRVVLSNAFGTAPLAVGAAHVAMRDKNAAIAAKSDRPLTFSGSPTVTIPAGAAIVSDAVNLTVPAFADLAIDIYLPGDTAATMSPLTTHSVGLQTNYVSPTGDHSGAPDMPVEKTTQSWFFLARVEVMAPEQTGVVVAIGDSITDGTRSTPDTNNRWPDHLARRLSAQKIKMGVLDLGISGNRLLVDGAGPNALSRFDRDVLVQPGVTHLIVLEGINDIRRTAPPVSVPDLIMAHRQIVERAHARGLKVFGGLLTPFEPNVWTPENEAKRQALNEWIRTSKVYDAVIDFDGAVRDPSRRTQILPKFDSGDHIHPSDAGYQAMANAIDLALLKVSQRAGVTN